MSASNEIYKIVVFRHAVMRDVVTVDANGAEEARQMARESWSAWDWSKVVDAYSDIDTITVVSAWEGGES